ncbi:MAG: methyltransferase domain-containing protein, partial [Candidatus Hodarchaeota archaeon]
MLIPTSTGIKNCYYCEAIKKLEYEIDYPIRIGIFSKEGIIYRCAWHAQFKCCKCGRFHHFSWLYWCPKTNELICGSCNKPTLTAIKFWDRTYTYTFQCEHCNKPHYDLFYAEYQGLHPWQQNKIVENEKLSKNAAKREIVPIINATTPESPIWKPPTVRQGGVMPLEAALKTENNAISIRKSMMKIFGNSELHSDLTPENKINYEESKNCWENTSSKWIEAYALSKEKDQGDINRQLIIDPALWKQMGAVKGLRVLDAGCGNGYLSRQLARRGAKVVGVDYSKNFIEYCIKQEKQTGLGCEFYQGSLDDLSFLESESFDLVVSNVVMVDVLDYKTAFKELNRILKPNRRFLWSNVHPVFGRWGQVTYRLPFDTKRNDYK